jgi:hypothetical protein
MEKIKCSNVECKSTEFYLMSESKGPKAVNQFGEIISPIEYIYKCCLCSNMVKSSIGPFTPPTKILHG